jgi:ABC-type transport system substrate-binding protein
MAIDVDGIIEKVVQRQGERITGPLPKQTDYYNVGIEPLRYDPKGALRLLAEAGWKRGSDGWLQKGGRRFRFTLIANKESGIRKAILSTLGDFWKRIGIDVRTEVVEWGVFIRERINKLDFDALLLGWGMGIEPDLYQIWHSSQTQPSQFNFVGFQNEEVDDLIIKIRQEYDHDRQVAYCHRLHEIIAEEQPYVIKDVDSAGRVRYRRIKPTKTGTYTFHFNKWVKLPRLPKYLRD